MLTILKKHNPSKSAFTLIEMIIVLIIIGILLMATIYMSWEQIQKVKNKTVKESILSEMQSRYSRNLWSSSFRWMIYNNMEVSFITGDDKIDFIYSGSDEIINTFKDKFEIKYIAVNYTGSLPLTSKESIKLNYSPYNITCKIWDIEDNYFNVSLIIRINDNKNYCFEINQKNCRLLEMSDTKCQKFKNPLGLE